MHGQKKMELILYMVLWAILFAGSAVSVYMDDEGWNWISLLYTWRFLTMFFITFFVHNFFVAPLLVYQNKRWMYAGLVTFLLALFFGYQLVKDKHRPMHPVSEEQRMKADDFNISKDFRMMEDDMHSRGIVDDMRTPPPPPLKDGPKPMREKPFGGPHAVACTIMFLLICLNVGAKYYFKSLDDRKRMKELERDNLNQQLQYLKYQINPHFFMNTLNNIHALVDIDPEEAKHTIEILSKLMRYVLYDADKPMASLQKELDFLSHYIGLMRIRYTDKVRITVSVPASVPDLQVPSLLFATFVENAFKHGISYRKDSFIEVGIDVDEASHELCFSCNNSMKPEAEERQMKAMQAAKNKASGKHQSGVGLRNAVKRLDLIYGNAYELQIDADSDEYRLMLRLPI